uniref:Homeobox domain-containing protein n=1 Tax=Eragrostis tef TaxID=110835 RepID=J9QGM8_ERATE|nr:hypothetical protein [Eragrostis tef]
MAALLQHVCSFIPNTRAEKERPLPPTLASPPLQPAMLSLPPRRLQGPRTKLDQQQAALALTLSPAYEGSLQSIVVLSGSRFLKPAQRLLDDICAALLPPEAAVVKGPSSVDIHLAASAGHHKHLRPEFRERKANLLHMQQEVTSGKNLAGELPLPFMISRILAAPAWPPAAWLGFLCLGMEVHERCNQHCQQMQMVVSSFESVPGLSSATPYASSVLKDVSKRFRRLRTIISKKIQYVSRLLEEELTSLPEGSSSGGKALAVWKPRKGRHPERAVSVLRRWFFDNFLHPYPSDEDKKMLATRTGLTQNQVSNWFGNARGRLWKPMVDEMHMLETLSSSSCSTPSLDGQVHQQMLEHHGAPPSMGVDEVQPGMMVPLGEMGGFGRMSLTLGLQHHRQQQFGGHLVG